MTAAVQGGQARVAAAGELDYDTSSRLRAVGQIRLVRRLDRIGFDLAKMALCGCAGLNVPGEPHIPVESRAQAHRERIVVRVDEVGPRRHRLFQLAGTVVLFGPADGA